MRDENDLNEPGDEKIDHLLEELTPVELPPFFRTRLLARARAYGRRRAVAARLLSPRLAWAVAAVSVAALVLVVALSREGRVPAPRMVLPGSVAAASAIDPLTPADDTVVGARDVEIVAAIDPPLQSGLIRLYVDDVDVTGLAEVTDSYVMYAPSEEMTEGAHVVTIEVRDASGMKLKDVSWLFYTMDGRERPNDRV